YLRSCPSSRRSPLEPKHWCLDAHAFAGHPAHHHFTNKKGLLLLRTGVTGALGGAECSHCPAEIQGQPIKPVTCCRRPLRRQRYPRSHRQWPLRPGQTRGSCCMRWQRKPPVSTPANIRLSRKPPVLGAKPPVTAVLKQMPCQLPTDGKSGGERRSAAAAHATS